MKKSTFWAIVYFIVMTAFSTVACHAQKATTYTLVNGKVTAVTATTTTSAKPDDSVYQVVNGVKFYKGARGGVYQIVTSKTTGKPYKKYVNK